MNPLTQLLDRLEHHISNKELLEQNTSKSSVGWHIEHTLLTINQIIKALTLCEPAKYRWTFKPFRYIIFAAGKIPRGKAKAPKIVQPKAHFDAHDLRNYHQETKKNVLKLDTMEVNAYFEHPYFGHLQLKQTVKFLCIHTQHHLSIVEDIIKNTK